MRVTVLGAGLVGRAIVHHLTADDELEVTVIDRDAHALERIAAARGARVKTGCHDLGEAATIRELASAASLVIGAVPGFMGFATLKAVIEAGVDVVDISFFAEDPFQLDELARARGVTAVVDCGVAPGLCNVIAGHAAAELDRMESYVCYVGGLPKTRHWPFEYKAGFSPTDVLEEYTRPARFVEHGQVVVRPALSDPELRDFPGVGTLEAFNTDGLRTLMKTLDAPFMKEKTLRYPGHANLMRVFRDSGFLNKEAIEVEGRSVRPFALTSKLLFHQWRLEEGEADFTVMQVIIEGQKAGRALRRSYDLLDGYDPVTGLSSMARTTGFTCAIVARQVARGLFKRPGISPPEIVGRTPGCTEELLANLARSGIEVRETSG